MWSNLMIKRHLWVFVENRLKGSRVEQEDQLGVIVVAPYARDNSSGAEEKRFNSE